VSFFSDAASEFVELFVYMGASRWKTCCPVREDQHVMHQLRRWDWCCWEAAWRRDGSDHASTSE
jgi:hypothetical protein